MKKLISYLNKYRPSVVVSILTSLISTLPIIFIPFLTGRMIDQMVINNTDFSKVISYLIIMASLIIGYFIFKWLSEYLISMTINKLTNQLRKDAFNHILNAPISRLDNYQDGAIIDRIIMDVEVVKDGLVQGGNQFFSNIFTIIGIIVMMFIENTFMALLVVGLTPISLIFAIIISKGAHNAFKRSAKARSKLFSHTEEMIQNQKIIAAMNYQNKAVVDFEEHNQEYRKAGFKAVIYASFLNPITRLINTIIYIAVGLLGAYLIISNKIGEAVTVGVLSSFLVYAMTYTKPFNEVSSVLANIQQAITSFHRLDELLELGENPNGTETIHDFKGTIEVNDLSFSYDEGENNVLQDINFTAKSGEKIAIVGETGSGKTTLIQLLMRYYLHKMGSLVVSGHEIKKLNKMNLRKYIGIVLQDPWIFQGTVYENIAYAKSDATKEQVIQAAKKAYADDFISRLENGYDTMINDEKSISQGEKQLIAIARIMLLDPPLLILDEATSNIDALTEIKIGQALQELMKNKTSIIIAHRLQTIQMADQILVMSKGRIVERGTHEELLQTKGTYYQIYESQFKAVLE